jgi:hypothetical protein
MVIQTCRPKRRYRDRRSAMLAVEKIRVHGEPREKRPVRAYLCPKCKGWHLTSAA